MKTLLLVLAVAGLSGCAVYPAAPYPYETYETSAPYVVTPPPYIHGGLLYQHSTQPRFYPRGYYRAQPGVRPYHPQRPPIHGPRPRDRDRDGIPNRLDRDRDGDGVPNRFDRRPNDWRR